MLNLIEAKLKTCEAHIEEGMFNDLEKLLSDILAYYKIADLTEDDKKQIDERIENIRKYIPRKTELQSIKDVSPKSIKIPSAAHKKINGKLVGFATGTAFTLIAGVAISCGVNSKNISDNTEQVTEVIQETEIPEVKEEPTEMSEELKAFSDTTVEAIDDALEAGINLSSNEELTEADKETYARVLTQYRIVANMDNLTKLEYAELFGEMGNPTEDLVEAFFEYNTSIKKHLITVTNDNMLDYNNLYNNEKDAEVLNESERLIATINDAKDSNERLEASKAWYSYIINILTSNEGNIALSSQALDSLITHSEAFDELTRSSYSNVQGAHIDDELEHYFNTAKNTCLEISKDSSTIDVEELTIENLKSVFRISFIERLQAKYQDALTERELQLTLGNSLNQYNSFNEVINYVESQIDLTKYNQIEIDYIEKQKIEKGVNAPAQKSKDDSGISNGQTGKEAGNISKSDMIAHGVNPSGPNAKEEYEKAVIEETNQKSEASARIEDSNGNVLSGTADDNRNGFTAAYNAGMNGQPKPSYTGNQSYDAGIDNGWAAYLADIASINNQIDNSSETTYVPVENGETTYTESTESYQDYTESAPITDSDVDYNTIFEPIEGYSEEETTTTFVPIDEASTNKQIRELYALRETIIAQNNTLLASLNEENSKTLS